LRVLAIAAPARLPGSQIPTLKEQGIDVEIGNWRGIYGAPGLLPDQRQAAIDGILAATREKVWQDALKANGWVAQPLAGAAFGKFVESENARFTAALKELGRLK
jgi:putative tricarboxylic transport membrane protein